MIDESVMADPSVVSERTGFAAPCTTAWERRSRPYPPIGEHFG